MANPSIDFILQDDKCLENKQLNLENNKNEEIINIFKNRNLDNICSLLFQSKEYHF